MGRENKSAPGFGRRKMEIQSIFKVCVICDRNQLRPHGNIKWSILKHKQQEILFFHEIRN